MFSPPPADWAAQLAARQIDYRPDAEGQAPADLTGHRTPTAGCAWPRSVEQVQALVRLAAQHRVALYPLSTGYNWGYGSRSPAQPGCVLVDLSRMNRILNAERISADAPVAVIEPGVTQKQLYEFLRDRAPDLTFNVTGSAGATSLLGNALDRGVGYVGPRREDVFGLEVVLGNGELLRTGFRRLGEDSPLAHSHPYGLGPMLDGLFFQGNFGIVTSACFRLLPRRPREIAVSFSLRDAARLPAFIDTLARLKREGVLGTVTHIGNRARSHAALGYRVHHYLEHDCGLPPEEARAEAQAAIAQAAPSPWTSLAGVSGTPAQVKAALREIRARMKPLAATRVLTFGLLDTAFAVTHPLRRWRPARAQAAVISAARSLHGLTVGQPGDGAIDNLLWRYGAAGQSATTLDETACGLIFICPALLLDGAFVARTVAALEAVAAQHGHTLYMTLNIETGTSLVAVINLLFDRRQPEEVRRAQACAAALRAEIHRLGLELFRARADGMDAVVDRDPAYWAQVRELKRALDPAGIIAPGRYNRP